VLGGALALSGIRETLPVLYTIVILHLATTPITSSAAFAALMGLDAAFALMALLVSCAIAPATTVTFSYMFLGTSLFSPIELGAKLFFFFAASGAIAYAIRRIAGQEWIERQKEPIDGLNLISMLVFAIAAMDGVPRHVMADPLLAAELLLLIVGLAGLMIGLSALVFLRAGAGRGLAIGLLAAFRNLGVIMAALGANLPDLAWFYFAMAQFPIYLLPILVQRLARRLAQKS